MIQTTRTFPQTFICLVASVIMTGCGGVPGPELGTVSGKVTLDGAPLDSATVEFHPSGDGRASSGVTDADGNYSLKYTVEKDGAIVGAHKVTITSAIEESGGEGDEPLVPAREEMLPVRYHEASELKADVVAGPNVLDFELTSEGPKSIEQAEQGA